MDVTRCSIELAGRHFTHAEGERHEREFRDHAT